MDPTHPLSSLGWTPRLADAFEPLRRTDASLVPALVSEEHRDSLRVLLAPGEERLARVGGRLRHGAASPVDLPAVGDWVAVEAPPGDGPALVHAVLPRRTVLVRKAPDRSVAAQVLAANVDTVLVTMPLDREFRAGLADRALALAWDGGAEPVLVLTKADLCENAAATALRVETLCPAARVVTVSAAAEGGVAALAPWLGPGRTAALLGPSGAGKSTLANRLCGGPVMETGEVRGWDGRGRHTTVHRQLLPLRGGGALVDTPGLREVALFEAEEGIGTAFADIAALAAACRFRDCRHASEPGCAVLAAADSGVLDPGHLESWRKVLREQAHLERKLGVQAAWAAKRQRRAWGRMVRDAVDRKRRLRDDPQASE
jgi:ribosome biogenesis GTPase